MGFKDFSFLVVILFNLISVRPFENIEELIVKYNNGEPYYSMRNIYCDVDKVLLATICELVLRTLRHESEYGDYYVNYPEYLTITPEKVCDQKLLLIPRKPLIMQYYIPCYARPNLLSYNRNEPSKYNDISFYPAHNRVIMVLKEVDAEFRMLTFINTNIPRLSLIDPRVLKMPLPESKCVENEVHKLYKLAKTQFKNCISEGVLGPGPINKTFFRQLCHFILSSRKYANEYVPLPGGQRVHVPKLEKLPLILWNDNNKSKQVKVIGYTCPGTLNPDKFKIMNGFSKNSLTVLKRLEADDTTDKNPPYVVHEVIENLNIHEINQIS